MNVLLVCLGNICRSPTAEGIFRDLARQRAPTLKLQFDSAGTGDYHIGQPPDRRSQRAARKRGIEIGDLRARQVVAEDLCRFDWVLAMDRANLAHLQGMRPRDSGARVELLLAVHKEPMLLDVPDPYDGDEQDFDRAFIIIEHAAAAWLDYWASDLLK
jgi:protein-tyrosine phosphatase